MAKVIAANTPYRMSASDLAQRIAAIYRLAMEVAALPVAHLHFRSDPCPEHIRRVFHYFTKPHPKYKVFQNKSFGAALIDLREFVSSTSFIESLRNCGRAGAERRRALAHGYRLLPLDRNQFVESIHRIHASCPLRQGRPMDARYLEKQMHYEDLPHFRYYGLFNEKELIAYCNLGIFGNFAVLDRVIGFKNNYGAMYLLITEIACELITEQTLEYLMYDTVFGAKAGMRDFKRRLGFRPYRARYTID